jgi:hypothetical protein
MSAGDNLNQQQFGRGDLEAALHRELGFREQHVEGKLSKHPVSGYRLQVGMRRQVAKPPQGSDEGPAEFNVIKGNMGWPPEEHVRKEPIKYVYRGMHQDEWAQAQARGHIQSDQRGTIAHWEGTNAATDARTAVTYLPDGATGVVAKIRVHPDDKWFTTPHDNYLRTREPIPLDRVVRVSNPFTRDERGRLSR